MRKGISAVGIVLLIGGAVGTIELIPQMNYIVDEFAPAYFWSLILFIGLAVGIMGVVIPKTKVRDEREVNPNDMKSCPSCGKLVPPDALRCSNCGTRFKSLYENL